jgi:hypothetical protein
MCRAEWFPAQPVRSKLARVVRDWLRIQSQAREGDDAAIQMLVWMSASGAETLREMTQNPELLAKLQTYSQHLAEWPALVNLTTDTLNIRRYLAVLEIAEALPFVRGPEARAVQDDPMAVLVKELVMKVWDVGQWYKRMHGLELIGDPVLMDPQACPYKEWPSYSKRASELPELSKDPASITAWIGCIMTAFDLTYWRPSKVDRLCDLAPNCRSDSAIRHVIMKNLPRKLRGMVGDRKNSPPIGSGG